MVFDLLKNRRARFMARGLAVAASSDPDLGMVSWAFVPT